MKPRIRTARPLIPIVATVAVVLAGAAVVGPGSASERVAEGRARLEAMPREHRLRLAERLAEFDALPEPEKARIRAFDEQIRALPEAEREDARRFLREYALWLDSLDPRQRERVEQADPANRPRIVAQVRERQRDQTEPAPLRNLQAALQVSTLAPSSLLLEAVELQCWFDLGEPARASILALPDPKARRNAFRRRIPRDSPSFRRAVGAMLPRLRGDAKAVETLDNLMVWRMLETAKAPRPAVAAALRKGEAAYIRTHDPGPIEPARLARFEAAMPPWTREGLDLLPPEAADLRLRLLYRLAFPEGREIDGPADTPGTPPRA